jgi:ADP-ribosylglycohydrolase
MDKENKENKGIIESLLLGCFLLDLFGSDVYYNTLKDLLSIIKNQNDNGEIIIEYISNFVANGGITGYTFDKNIENSSNIILFLSMMNTLLIFENDKNLFLEIKKSIKETFLQIWNEQKKDKTIIKLNEETTEKSILKINYDENYIGYSNNNLISDICVRIIPVGIMFSNDIDKLIEIVIKTTRLTHNNTISILSAIATSYFVSLALNKIEIEKWSHMLIELINSEIVKKHIDFNENKNIMEYSAFVKYWINYNDSRFSEGKIKKTRSDDNLIYRIKFYKKYKYDDYGFVILGEDCVNCLIIAYDTLLNCNGNFERVIYYGMLIPGEIISIGGILGALFGIVYGTETIPPNILKYVSPALKEEKITKIIKKIYKKLQ